MRETLAITLCVAWCGCASAPPLSMTCQSLPEAAAVGTALSARIELHNDTEETVTLLGRSVPWSYHYAAHFSSPGFSDPHVVVEPTEIETLILLPGETAGGDVAMGGRLLDSFGRSIEDLAGEHEIEVRSRLVIDPDTRRRRDLEMQCHFEVTVTPAP